MTGVSVMLIGASLITAGIKYVGGGVFCAENDLGRSAAFGGPQLCNETSASRSYSRSGARSTPASRSA